MVIPVGECWFKVKQPFINMNASFPASQWGLCGPLMFSKKWPFLIRVQVRLVRGERAVERHLGLLSKLPVFHSQMLF